MNFASSIYSKLEPRIEDEIGRTTTTEGRSFFVSETRPIIRDVLFSRGKTRALYQVGGERRDTPSSKETKIVLRPGYKLQISLPSPANARLLVYPACRGCLRFFLPLLTPFSIQFRVACSVPSLEFPRLANDETPSLREWKLQEISSDSSPTRVLSNLGRAAR